MLMGEGGLGRCVVKEKIYRGLGRCDRCQEV